MQHLKPSQSVIFTELHRETIDATGPNMGRGMTCSQCGKVAARDKLFIYTTVRGVTLRTHNGQFCSKNCHDIFHGLRPGRK